MGMFQYATILAHFVDWKTSRHRRCFRCNLVRFYCATEIMVWRRSASMTDRAKLLPAWCVCVASMLLLPLLGRKYIILPSYHIMHSMHLLPTSTHLDDSLGCEIKTSGITGAFKPYHFANGTSKIYPIHEKSSEMTRFYARLRASTPGGMAEVYNWWIGLGMRRDLRRLRVRKL